MAWSIDYNGFGSSTSDWIAINITGYKAEAVMGVDGMTHESTRHELTGTALIKEATAVALENKIVAAQSRLSRQGKALNITTGDTDPVIADLDGDPRGDEFQETPICEFSVQRIYGSLGALVGFRFIWHDLRPITAASEVDTYHVMSHVWTQRFEIDEVGNQLHIVNGAIRVRNDVTAVSGVRLGPDPDAYRCIIVPGLPGPGFRRKSMVFATDESKQRLIYTIENQEYPRKLPGPGRTGECRFTWRRGLEAGSGLLGLKVFDAELEGASDANGTDLLNSLIRVAQNRIRFAGAIDAADQIMEIEVREVDVFNRHRVGLRIIARGTGSDTGNPFNMGSHTFRILDDISKGTQDYEPPDAYGVALLKSVRATLFDPTTGYTAANFPISQTTDAAPCPATDYQLPDTTFANLGFNLVQKGAEADFNIPDHRDRPYVAVKVVERFWVNPHIVTLKSQSLEGDDAVYQTEKPDVFLVSEFHVSRQYEAPPEVFLRPPSGTVLKHLSRHISPGVIDANNNRQFDAVYVRVLQILDIGQSFWITENIDIAGGITIKRFRTASGILAFPHSPQNELPENARDRTIFQAGFFPDGYDFTFLPEEYATP